MPDLDPRQKAAVDAGPVDLFVAAGAGSGKTHVLTSRFVSAVLGEGGYEPCGPGELLAVTFTEKSAGELTERIRRALGAAGAESAARTVSEAWISTIHGMCSRILRQHALIAGLDPLFRVLDQIEAAALEASCVEEVVSGSLRESTEIAGLLDRFSFRTVIPAMRSVRSAAHALGLEVEDIQTLPAEPIVERLATIACELRETAAEMSELGLQKTVENNAAVLSAAGRLIDEVLSCEPLDASRLLREVSSKGTRELQSVDGLNELLESGRALVAESRMAAAQMLVAEHERAFLSLVAAFSERYSLMKRVRGMLDFEDLQVETARLLEEHPEVAQEYQARFSMLMLDEFQDTNALQLQIVEALSAGNLCTVGDENQSIYAFRNADVEVFRERGRRTPNRRQLDINYRIEPSLLTGINGLFSDPALFGSGYMTLSPPEDPSQRRTWREWPEQEPRLEVRFIDWTDASGSDGKHAEARCIADRVAELVRAGIEPSDIVVLLRALAGGRAGNVERALAEHGIRAYLAAGGEFFGRPEVVEARALLKVIDNVMDDESLAVILAGRTVGLSVDSLVKLRRRADEIGSERSISSRDVHLWDALTGGDVGLPSAECAALGKLVRAVTSARKLCGVRPLRETVLAPLQALEIDLVLFTCGQDGARGWANLLKLARLAAQFEVTAGGDLGGFLDYLDLRELYSVGEQEATLDGEFDAVRVMSIHAAKGLEFPVVVVGGFASGHGADAITVGRIDGRLTLGMRLPGEGESLPTLASQQLAAVACQSDDAEAVRLLYVACTRAEEGLTIVARAKPAKDADDSLEGALRCAIGAGPADSIVPGDVRLGVGRARVSLISPAHRTEPAPVDMPEGMSDSACPEPLDDRGGLLETVGREPAAQGSGPGPWMGCPETRDRGYSPGTVPKRVSYTGLSTYQQCPYRFYLTSIMNLPAPPDAQDGQALTFGAAVHSALEHITCWSEDTPNRLRAIARSAGLERAAFARLEAAVRTYLELPVAAEISRAAHVMREAPIAVAIGGTVLAGAIDAIAWDGDDALIVDYKTGALPLSERDAVERYRLQSQCYALAAFEAGAHTVRTVFAELERGRQTPFAYMRNDESSLRDSVASVISRMTTEGYRPGASYKRGQCDTCPGLGGMCPVTRQSGGGAA